MKIRTAELFCASPASTAICTTMNQHAMVRRGGSGTPRPINRHHNHNYYNNHYQFDFEDKPKFKVPTIPCTSQQHIDPKPYTAYLQKARKSISTTGKDSGIAERRKSSADESVRNYRSAASAKYLLNNPMFVADGDDVCNAGALVVSEPVWPDYHDEAPVVGKKSLSSRLRGEESPALVKSGSSKRIEAATAVVAVPESPCSKALKARSRDQVVELRVSIHCKGCAGKVRKHISRMEGVTSFNIDLESKKVTVVGDVTPLSVLTSISKVKNAQLWPSTSPSSSSSPLITIGY
ncbi:putative heavy metal-associated domain, HMA, heavy metal-associated domain superfamily [Helianthus debilis subsp. tardiflorus]